MSTLNKFSIGLGAWVVTTYAFGYWSHVAPEGIYNDMGSGLEVASVGLMVGVFFGIPIVTGLWINNKGKWQ